MRALLKYSLLLFSVLAFSQEKDKDKDKEKDKYLPKGNKAFAEKKYADAEANYRISQSKSPANAKSAYNLGNSIYRQKHPGEAKFAYLKAIEDAQTKTEKHRAYHNLGNTLMEEKNYQGAVEAYKNALRNNPADDETRYNYALAKDMLDKSPPKKDPPPPPQKQDKKENKSQAPKPKDDKKEQDKKESGDGEKEKKDKEQKDKQDDKGQQKPDKGNPGNDPSQASPSKQRMENLLDAMNNEEKKVQDRINAKKGKAKPQQTEKDW